LWVVAGKTKGGVPAADANSENKFGGEYCHGLRTLGELRRPRFGRGENTRQTQSMFPKMKERPDQLPGSVAPG